MNNYGFSDNAVKVLSDRYLMKNSFGDILC